MQFPNKFSNLNPTTKIAPKGLKRVKKGQNGAKLKIKIGQFWKIIIILTQTKPNRTKKVKK